MTRISFGNSEENRNVALTPSERAHLIRAIGDSLSDNSWSIIDMTLRQFDLPTTDVWQRGTHAYVIAMVEDGSDKSLVELGSHLGCEPELMLSKGAMPSFWEDGHFRLFISHLWKNRSFAEEIEAELHHFGISSFIAHRDIEPTQVWQNEIESALATCDAMLALLHPDFHGSNWTDQEIGYGMGRQLLIVTVDLGTTPYGFMGKFQALTGTSGNPTRLAGRLFDILRQHARTQRKTAEAAVHFFAESPSFDEAKRRMALLEELEYWDDGMTAKAGSALEDNNQIADAWTVPHRLERLIQKWTTPNE